MRVCKYCQVKMQDNDLNCPLCGAHTEVVDLSNNITPAPYPSKINKLPVRPIVKNIFISLLVIVLAAFLAVSMLSSNWTFFFVAAFFVSYAWIGVLRFCFYPQTTRSIIAGVFGALIVYVNLICLYFHINGREIALEISFGLITPILLAIINVVYVAIVLIGKKWHKFAYPTFRLAVLEILMFVAAWLFDFNPVASIVCGSIGVITILFALIFGRAILFTDFKKRFHI